MPKFYVEVECMLRELFSYDDIEAEDESKAIEQAMDRAEGDCSFEPDDINLVDVDEMDEEDE